MSLAERLLSIYRTGGFYGIYHEGKRHIRQHPIRILLYAKLQRLNQIIRTPYSAIADPTKLLHVDPERIQKVSEANFSTSRDVGRIEGGDWDKGVSDFTEKKRFKATQKRFEEDYSWEQTGIIDYYLRKIEENGRYDGCYNRRDVEKRYQTVDKIYRSIREEGYNENKVENMLDHVCVHIGRDGELLHAGIGNHRLSIAKILEIDSIPVRVVVRHTEWQKIREDVHDSKIELSDKETHPDLRDIV